eukprot:scaffold13.g296.t1
MQRRNSRRAPAAGLRHRDRGRAGAGADAAPAAAAESAATPAQAPPAAPPLQRADSVDSSSALSLSNIRQTLIRLEDTIIFALIERAQFALNPAIYRTDAIPVHGSHKARAGWGEAQRTPWDGTHYSLLEYFLRTIEQVHGRIRRYTSPDEHAYFPDDVPDLALPPITYPQASGPAAGARGPRRGGGAGCRGAPARRRRSALPGRGVLAPGSEAININDRIMVMYLDHLLPQITQPGDDGNYGSSVMDDTAVLQALSKRIHYGKFEYTELIRAGDAEGIMVLLTDRAVEVKVLERVKLKAATFGQDLSNPAAVAATAAALGGYAATGGGGAAGASLSSAGGDGAAASKVPPEVVGQAYEEFIMPLTKEVEVQYLLRRLDVPDSWRPSP